MAALCYCVLVRCIFWSVYSMNYIKIDEKSYEELDKYCNLRVRSAQLSLIMDRILRPFLARGGKMWYKDKNVIPKLPDIPEGKLTTVPISKEHAKSFRLMIDKINTKHEIELNPDCVASWLAHTFCMIYEFKKKNEGYFHDFGHLKRG